jgi:hypothetical protein
MNKLAVTIVAMFLPVTAYCQNDYPGYPVPPVSASELPNYCLHNNAIYSVGATICVSKQGLVCVPPPNPNNGPRTGGRAYWSSSPVETWVPPLGLCL